MKMKTTTGLIALALAATLAAQTNSAPIEVKTVRPTRGDIYRYVTLPATLRADQQVTLYPKVAGYLKSIAVDKGDRVRAGQPLAEIEVPELIAVRTRWQAEAEVEVADAAARRIIAAAEKAPDLVTAGAVDEAKGRLKIAQANLARTATLLAYCTISAPFSGAVTRIGFALDEATRTMLVEADLPNPAGELRPGMYAKARTGVEKHPDALLVPAEAVAIEKGGASAFVVADGKAKKIPLTIGFYDGQQVEVVKGVDADESVVLVGKLALSPSQPVKAVSAP